MRTELGGLPRELLHRFKFERAQSAASSIASLMYEAVNGLGGHDLIIPVPTATNRLRERGYDHAWLLARELGLTNHLPAMRLLMRLNQTRQVGTKRDQRLSQLRGAFRVTRPGRLQGAHVLLVDDVLTTGATLEEAALTLRKAGVAHVDAVVFAQKSQNS